MSSRFSERPCSTRELHNKGLSIKFYYNTSASDATGSIESGARVVIVCRNGNYIRGSDSLRCEDGFWDQELPMCESKSQIHNQPMQPIQVFLSFQSRVFAYSA